uniref:CCHC-type domain-containing protein n=1 Tax=Aegilops tauschii subsp. strangulata TaxID=200361 RepID=A0A453Q4K1_AEGTS
MNRTWGESLGAKIGTVEKVDVDSQGRAWGNYLRVRVSVEISKPLLRWVTAYSKKKKAYERYEVQYERIPHYCFSCGIIGHSSLECPTPGERDEEGKLPYNADRLCVKDDRKKNILTSWSGQSPQSSGKSSHCGEKNSGAQRSPRSNSEEKDSDIKEMQDGVTSPFEKKELDYKQK